MREAFAVRGGPHGACASSPDVPPLLGVETRSVRPYEGKWLVRLRAINRGNATAAGLTVETSESTVGDVPARYRADRPAPLLVTLHGAGASARAVLSMVKAHAEATGAILLLPESRGRTWDVILGDDSPDVAFIDEALRRIFEDDAIDPARIAIAGFSDGASYALSLGLINGGLFTHVIAFSPGFVAPTRERDAPRLFISHGIRDRVLPIDRCSRRIVPRLRRAGSAVESREFEGGHVVPPAIARRDAVVCRPTAGDRPRRAWTSAAVAVAEVVSWKDGLGGRAARASPG